MFVSAHGMRLFLVVFFAAILAAASEAGFRLGRKAESRTAEKTKAHLGAIEGGILGVLALLLGFTISMAVTRFEVRKQLVLEEANAIETSYLRTRLLPAPESTEIANLLREYVVVRLQYADVGDDLDRLQAMREQAVRLQNEFWTVAVAYGQKDPSLVKAGLLLQSLNQVIDLESARWMAFQDHVPPTVIYVNYVVALFVAILVGYAFGREGRRQVFSTSMLVLAITVVLAVIVDLDQPRQGFIKVSQQPLVDLQHQLLKSKQ
jgi:hypothetical protein